jgi:serine/threonine protein phosphatase PrpC
MDSHVYREDCFEAVTISNIGDRQINQDRTELFSRNGIHTLVLADGMGGHPRGEVAAQIFVDTARLILRKHANPGFSAEAYIKETMSVAHEMIQAYGLRQDPEILPRTTAVIVTIHGDTMQWAHLGDSRTYLFRHGRAHVRTLDHSPVEILRLQGDIEDTDAQSIASGRSGITKCLGGKNEVTEVMVTVPIALRAGDMLLLCSDGVWSQLKQAELENLMLDEQSSLEERTATLVDTAVHSRKGRSDNATALAFKWLGIDKTPADKEKQDTANDNIDAAIDQLKQLIDRYS